MEQPASRRVATPVAWIALVAAALALAVALLPAPLAHADDDPAADAARAVMDKFLKKEDL